MIHFCFMKKKKTSVYVPVLFVGTFFLLLAYISIGFTLTHHSNILGISTQPNPTSPVKNTPFLSAYGTKVYLNGDPYRFVGVNAYHLGGMEGVSAGCGGMEKDINQFLSSLRPNSVVRTWAFQGGMAVNTKTKQIDWTGLDRLVNEASKSGTRLILTIGDQSGTCDDGHWRDIAWYEGGFRTIVNDLGNGLTPLSYFDYVKAIVSRYKDSKSIAMWEPINEPIAVDCAKGKGSQCFSAITCSNESRSRKALRTFFDTVGGEIKKIDPNHMVSSGTIGDGQCGTVFEDYQYVHQSPGIDIASFHDYGRETQVMPGDQWNGLQKRLNQMKLIQKPLFIGEAGIKASENGIGCMKLGERANKMRAKMNLQFQAGIVGYLPWDFTNGTSKICNYDIVAGDPLLEILSTYPLLATK